ncbi:MAG: hypothetical protein HYU60_02210 [Magnetospirillum sp.]|nr:hypothetical protein [Magnetospirillum sp.]
MPRIRHTARTLDTRTGEPFGSAEEAWFWYAQCQLARLDGARSVASAGATCRPCDPDDIYRAVDALYRRRRIDRTHVSILGRYGLRLCPPSPDGGGGRGEFTLWQEALDRLATILRHKGIVA